jgi:hypothetical protein
MTSGGRVAARTALGSVGWLGGALIGGRVGIALGGTNCNCDDPGLDSFLYGAAVGSVVATALTVSAMPLRDGCSRPTRFLLALGGAVLGTAGGGALAMRAPTAAGLLLFPLGGGLGAAGAAALCSAGS